jgi:uncharacterized metal-binding protein
MKAIHPRCASCPVPIDERACLSEDGKGPAYCPTLDEDLVSLVRKKYGERDLALFAKEASIQEGEGYCGREEGNSTPRPCKPRILEIVEFARRMGYEKLGLVFCVGLVREAAIVEAFLSDKGFQVVSVICKAGNIPKESIGVSDDEKIRPGQHEAMCNPVLQALALNRASCDFNIVLGLCVGHDSLFLSHSEAPCTVLAAKDRPTGHNPLAAVYTLNSYYRFSLEDS